MAAVRKAMPDNTIEMMLDSEEPGVQGRRFKRIYICLGPLKKGFTAGCRPLIGLDVLLCMCPAPAMKQQQLWPGLMLMVREDWLISLVPLLFPIPLLMHRGCNLSAVFDFCVCFCYAFYATIQSAC